MRDLDPSRVARYAEVRKCTVSVDVGYLPGILVAGDKDPGGESVTGFQ